MVTFEATECPTRIKTPLQIKVVKIGKPRKQISPESGTKSYSKEKVPSESMEETQKVKKKADTTAQYEQEKVTKTSEEVRNEDAKNANRGLFGQSPVYGTSQFRDLTLDSDRQSSNEEVAGWVDDR